MVDEYYCPNCDEVFETSQGGGVTRCPECLCWDAVPVGEYENGTVY